MHAKTEKAQIRVTQLSSAYWRVTFDNPASPVASIRETFIISSRQ
jgi:hypothetical protein